MKSFYQNDFVKIQKFLNTTDFNALFNINGD